MTFYDIFLKIFTFVSISSVFVIQTTKGRKNLEDIHIYVAEIFRTESSTTRLRFALNDKL